MNANATEDKQKRPMLHVIAEAIFPSVIVVGAFYALVWLNRTLVSFLLHWIPDGTFEANEVDLMDILYPYVYTPLGKLTVILYLGIFALIVLYIAGVYIAQSVRNRRARRTGKE